MNRKELLELADRCEKAEGLLVGEMTAKLLREARSVVWPQPAHIRVPRQADGSPWGGDGIGPYTEEYKAWGRITEPFEAKVRVGAFLDAALTLVPEGWALHLTMQTYARGDEFDRKPRVTLLDHETNTYRVAGEAEASTAALALVAASLRALAGGEG